MANEKNLGLSTLQGAFERYDNSLANVAKSGKYVDIEESPLQLESEAVPASGHYWGRDMPLGSTWFPNTTRENVDNYQWYAWYYTYGTVDYQKQTYLTHWVPMIYQICQEAGCPITVSDVTDWTTVATDFQVKLDHASYQATVKYAYTSGHRLGYQIEIPNRIIIRVFSSVTEPGEFVASGIETWTIQFVLPSIPSSESIYFEADTRVPAVPAVWESDGDLEIWDNISDKPTLATVATSGDYDDLSNKPDLATVATSGNYNDLSNKPSTPPDRISRSIIGVCDSAYNATRNITVVIPNSNVINLPIFYSESGQLYTENGARLKVCFFNGTYYGPNTQERPFVVNINQQSSGVTLPSGMLASGTGQILGVSEYDDREGGTGTKHKNGLVVPPGCYADFIYIREVSSNYPQLPPRSASVWQGNGYHGYPAVWMLDAPIEYRNLYCATSTNTPRKRVCVPCGSNIAIQTGTRISITFKYPNTGSVSALEFASITKDDAVDTNHVVRVPVLATDGSSIIKWSANETVDFIYNGESFIQEAKPEDKIGLPNFSTGITVNENRNITESGLSYSKSLLNPEGHWYKVSIMLPQGSYNTGEIRCTLSVAVTDNNYTILSDTKANWVNGGSAWVSPLFFRSASSTSNPVLTVNITGVSGLPSGGSTQLIIQVTSFEDGAN